MTTDPKLMFTSLVAITHLPAGEEFTVRQLREKLAAMGIQTERDGIVTRIMQEAAKRGLMQRTRKVVQQQRKDRIGTGSTNPTPVYVRTDVTHIHAPPGRVEEAEKTLSAL